MWDYLEVAFYVAAVVLFGAAAFMIATPLGLIYLGVLCIMAGQFCDEMKPSNLYKGER